MAELAAKIGQLELPGDLLALQLCKLSGACSRSVGGLIGAGFFCVRVVELDCTAQELRVLAASPAADATNAILLEERPCALLCGGEHNPRQESMCACGLWVPSK